MQAKQHAINLYMHGIRDGNMDDALEHNTGDRYTQHSTGVRDGREGFKEFFAPFLERNPVRDLSVVRALQDGKHVFVHVYQNLNNGDAQWVTTDFFDSDESNKIIEHWDVISEYVAQTPSGRSNVDGPSEITDLDKTSDNKAIVRGFVDTCLIGSDTARMAEFISSDSYVQHSLWVADGLEATKAFLDKGQLSYQECVLMVAEGNFVATLNRAQLDGQEICLCDLYRLEGGKIVEHWDNYEPIPPRDEWVNSGKF